LRKASAAKRDARFRSGLAPALPKDIDLHDKYRPSLQNRESAMRPLEGLFVLDFSTLLPGPLATLLLAEAGAEVVKIEPPRGEEMRGRATKWGHDSVGFALLNRGKRSVALDLKNAAEQARLQPLVKRADVIVEQFRPGVMARLGLDYVTVAKLNPTVVYCSISGYGQSGLKRDVAAHDLNYIGDAGLLALSMGDPSRPVLPPTLIADIAGGAYPAVVNILLALEERRRTGRGRHLDVAMADNLFPLMFWAIGQGLVAGAWPGNGAGYVTGGSPRYGLYPTKDGRVVAAAPLEQKFWETFCDLIGLEPEFRDDGKNPAATKARIAAIIATETADIWRSRFAGKDCCCTIVANLGDALTDPHYTARGVFHRVLTNPEGAAMPALPVPLDPGFRAAPATAIASPALGADNKTYLA
jgi:crotonobetainyl-CoA:carnitine CoA-transferase CaiB-like acyl-CoA transferase